MTDNRNNGTAGDQTRRNAARSERLAAWGLLTGLAIGLFVGVLSADGAATVTGRLGGDFQAFYGAGRIAAAGDWADLYNLERQRQAQESLWAQEADTVLYFAYPPAIALLYAPLTALEFRWAFLIHTLLMVGALALGINLLKPFFPWLREHLPVALAAAVFFYPLMRATLGGQNTALTLLVIALVWRLASDGRGLLAGLALAALFYKPQFALPVIGLFLLDRRWRALAGVGLGVALLYALNASVMGVDWLSTWWGQAVEFARLDASVNKHGSVSWVGFLQTVRGPSDTVGLTVGWALAVLHIAFLVYFWTIVERADWAARFAVLAVGILLISPHTMYYDAGLALLALIVLWSKGASQVTKAGVLLLWASAWTHVAARGLGFSPLFILLVAVAVWTGIAFARRARPAAEMISP